MSEQPPTDPSSASFVPVCAIGASAGGVGALQTLFRLLPDDLGLAYVVVVHLSPDHPSAMHEILGACTKMPVFQVTDGPTLRANSVYVIAPDSELVIKGDDVTSRPFTDPRGRRAPIDMFFRSIAVGRGDGIAVVLTGAGSDGALGVRAIKEAGGIVMVQEPAEAGFPSMPQNAIATGVADVVAPLARLAERIAEAAQSKEAVRSLDADGAANDVRRIVAFLRTRTGHDFSGYKRSTVLRRIQRRMQVCQITNLTDYAQHLRANPEEAKELLSDLLISVTMFFRDPATFVTVSHRVIRPLLDSRSAGETEDELRAWVVGCATGEEAYSLAIVLLEEADQLKVSVPIQIFATDLDEGALATAREGRYPRSIEADVSAERLKRFFVDEVTHYRIDRRVRDLVLFATHSVVREPPFMRLDLITCRNVLIYLERSLQHHVNSIFRYGLKVGGYLFLGTAETADTSDNHFAVVDRDARIYRALPTRPEYVPTLAAPSPRSAGRPALTESRLATARLDAGEVLGESHAAALEDSAPPSALVDAGQGVLHLSPTVGRFILMSAGPLSGRLPRIVRPELRLDLKLALDRAFDAQQPTITRPIDVAMEGETRRVSLYVAPLPISEGAASRAIVYFLDSGPGRTDDSEAPGPPPDELQHLHSELKVAQEAELAGRMRHESVVQELRASNEELQSLNEEYRSTAEELETSKEELQSINEELQTVNAELKSKLAIISAAHNDLQNLTASSEIGTLFLDRDLRIRMFTPRVAELINVAVADVGRPITNFTHRLDYDDIESDVRRVLRELTPLEREVCTVDARWFMVRVRPYRTLDGKVEGAVVTFDDITERKRAEAALRASVERFRALATTGGNSIYHMSPDWRLMYRLDSDTLDPTPEAIEDWVEKYIPTEDLPTVRAAIAEAIRTKSLFELEHRVRQADGSIGWVLSRAVPLLDSDGEIAEWFGAGNDVTDRRRALELLRESEERYHALFAASPVPFMVLAANPPDFTITAANDAYFSATLTTRETLIGRRLFDVLTDDPARPGQLGSEVLAMSLNRVLTTRRTDAMDRVRYDLALPGGGFEPHWWLAINAPMLDASGNITAIIHQVDRQTELHLAEEAEREHQSRQAFLLTLSDTLRPLTDPAEVQTVAMKLLAEQLDVMRASFFEVEDDNDTFHLTARCERDAPPVPERMRLSDFSPVLGDAYRSGRTLAVSDTAIKGELVAEPEAYAAVGIQAWAGVPLLRGGRLAAWIGVHSRTPRDWSAADLKVLDDVAERTWGAVERTRAEAALGKSEARFRTLAETAPALIWQNDAAGDNVFVNRYFLDYAGLSADEDGGEKWRALIHPDDAEIYVADYMEAVRQQRPFHNRNRIRRRDGVWRWFENYAQPLFDEQGRYAGHVGVSTDVTVNAEAELSLRESEQRQQLLIQGVPQLVWRAVDGGRWTWASSQWTEYTGQPEADSHGYGWLGPVHPDDRDYVRGIWAGAVERGEYHADYRLRHASEDRYRWFQSRATPTRDDKGEIVEWLGTSTDVDDLRRLQERQGVLVAELQHRTRNLITVVRAVSQQTLREAASLNEFRDRFGDRLSALSRVQGLLSNLSAGQRVTFDDLIGSELAALGAPGDKVTLDGPNDVSLRSATVQTFSLALHELATNALKYGALASPEGHLTVGWKVTVFDDGASWLRVDWRETGVDMSSVHDRSRGGGYGRELIEHALPYQLNAKTFYEVTPVGIHCTIDVPTSSPTST